MDIINLMAIGALEEAELNNVAPLPRRFRFINRDDPFETLSDVEFQRTYRLTKNMVIEVCDIVQPFVPISTRRSSLDLRTKVLTALNFYAYGSYQLNIGQNLNQSVSQPSVSRALCQITDALNTPEIFNRFVHFPRNINELQRLRNEFYIKYQFPGVIGCIDCTHIAIYPPRSDDPLYPEHIYINRKGYHSINTQLICDANLKILNVSARYPGSSHDTFIWNNSNVQTLMRNLHEHGHKNFFLLGDSGYPLRSYLLTPCNDAAPGTPEERYNISQKRTRSIIERCNGVLKLRFRCLLKHRMLHYSPERASKIINACVVLHNMCIDANLPNVRHGNEDIDLGMYNADVHDVIHEDRNVLLEGRRQRDYIIRTRFN